MKEHNINNTQNHDTRYNVVHPQCRGYVHRTAFYSTFYKNHSSDLRTQLQILQVLKAAHTAADLLNHQKPSAHTATEVVHTHSWDLTFSYKIALALHQFLLHKKPNLSYLQECLFIQLTITKPWTKTMGTLNPKPWT